MRVTEAAGMAVDVRTDFLMLLAGLYMLELNEALFDKYGSDLTDITESEAAFPILNRL